MRILALTRYQRLGSSSRVRFYQYFPFLKSQGVELIHAPFFDDQYVRDLYAGHSASLPKILQAYINRLLSITRKNKSNLLWVEKELLPWFPTPLERLFEFHKTPYVVDYDDAVFHRYDMHQNHLVRKMLGHKIDHVMSNARLVIAGNDYLAERAKKAGAVRVEILPSVVDVSRYTIKQPDAEGTFKIGWIGSPVTAKYLDMLREVITQLNRESNVRLLLVGAGNASPFPEIPTTTLTWSEELERTVTQHFDVGIMPLVDGPFERGKCGYKLIQYMAGGVPTVASPVGVNRQIVEHEKNGYLANSSEEWLSALRALRDNPRERHEMGKAGRLKAETQYNLEVTAPQLFDFLNSVMNS